MIAVVLALYADPLFVGRVFFYRDLGTTVGPVLAQAWADPRGWDAGIPFWTHAISNGRPLAANPGYSMLGPLGLLFAHLPFYFAFDLFLVLHVAVAGCTMTLLARSIGCSRTAAFAAGTAYALGGGLVSALVLYWTVAAAAWAPLVLAAGLTAARDPTPRRVALLALPIGLQAVGGQPEPVVATWLVGLAASLAWATGPFGRRARVAAAAWITGIAGGLALAAPQLLPAALHARTTLRAVGFSSEGLLYNSLHPLRVFWLAIPGLGGNPLDALRPGGFPGASLLDGSSPYLTSIYIGIVAAGLAAAALAGSCRLPASRMLAWTFAALALLGILLALGRYVPGASALVSALPFPVPFRFAEKALYVTFLAVPPLAALGIDTARTLGVPRLSTLLAAAVLLDLALVHRGHSPTIDCSELAAPPLARELVARSHGLGIADGAWRVHHERQRGSGGWGPAAGSIEPDMESLYRWQLRMLVPPTGAPHGIRAAMELQSDHLDDARYLLLTRAAYSGPRGAWPLALGEAGVLWVVSPRATLEAETSGALVPAIALGPEQGVPAGSGYVYRNTLFVPRARITADIRHIAAPALAEAAAIAARRYAGAGPWPPETLVESGHGAADPPASGGPVQAGRVESIEEDSRGLTLRVAVDQAGVLALSDVPADLRSWRGQVDGRPAPVWRANLAYLAVPVRPGDQVVRLDYRPRGLRAGIALMLAALGAVSLALLFRGRRARGTAQLSRA